MGSWRIRAAVLATAVLAVAMASVCPGAQPPESTPRPTLAIVPFANNTARGEAPELLMPLLERMLTERGFAFVSSDSLRPLLRAHRVRSRGWIGRQGAELIRRETGVQYLLLGSWDVFRREDNPEVGFSLRVLDLEHMAIVAAVSAGGTGADTAGLLDLGRVHEIELLAGRVMVGALDDLLPVPDYTAVARTSRGCNHVVVIPLDDYSATEFAGDIVTNILLSQLLAAGYFVVEPGFVRELGLAREVVVRGGVDRGSAQAILDSLGACQAITGAVQRFDPARGVPTSSVPQFAAGFRASSTRTGSLYLMREIEGAGDQGEGIFQLGREHAIIPLVADRMRRFVEDLRQANRKDIIHGP